MRDGGERNKIRKDQGENMWCLMMQKKIFRTYERLKKKVREKEVEEEEKGKRDYPHALR